MSAGVCDFSIEGDYDGDTAKFMRDDVVRARKPHCCFECGDVIPAGARYQRIAGKWDGKMETYCFCLPCQETVGEFVDGAHCFGTLWDELEHNWDEGAHLQACLNRLTTVAAKAHMRERWLKWKGLAEPAAPSPEPPA